MTVLAVSLGSCLMIGSKIFFAQASWHTIEHSSGVTLMFKKPCF